MPQNNLNTKDLQSRIKELEEKIKILEKNKPKKFGLVWEEKKEDVVEKCKENIPILKLKEKSKSVEPILILDKDKPENILIEGDNYEALNVLNYTHKGKIDIIYIDPPYNTGNTDWKYNNDYVDGNDQWRHSKWIQMMYHRLSTAKKLLSDDGFIICAIDHYELFYVGLLMDEIFDEENRLGVVSVIHKPGGRNQEKFFSSSNEFMIVFAKNKKGKDFNKVVLNEELLSKFEYEDEEGKYTIINFIRDHIDDLREKKPNMWYSIFVNPKNLSEISLNNVKGYIEVLPISNSGREMSWKTQAKTFLESIKNNEIVVKEENKKIVIYKKFREQQIVKTHWDSKKYNSTHYGTYILEEILGGKCFNFPKSLYLIIDILKLTSKNDSIILDFFAGSGTTGHAVLELNKQDSGSRKFILCTNNENKIAEEVTYERVKRVMSGYKNKKGEKVEGLGGNLKYFKTSFVDKDKIEGVDDETKLKLTYEVGEMIGLKEDTLNEIEKTDYWQIFADLKEEKITAIYFKEDKEKLGDLVKKLEKIIIENKPGGTKINSEKYKGVKVALYVFSWTKNKYRNEYGSEDIRVEDIPEPILEVYKDINKI